MVAVATPVRACFASCSALTGLLVPSDGGFVPSSAVALSLFPTTGVATRQTPGETHRGATALSLSRPECAAKAQPRPARHRSQTYEQAPEAEVEAHAPMQCSRGCLTRPPLPVWPLERETLHQRRQRQLGHHTHAVVVGGDPRERRREQRLQQLPPPGGAGVQQQLHIGCAHVCEHVMCVCVPKGFDVVNFVFFKLTSLSVVQCSNASDGACWSGARVTCVCCFSDARALDKQQGGWKRIPKPETETVQFTSVSRSSDKYKQK